MKPLSPFCFERILSWGNISLVKIVFSSENIRAKFQKKILELENISPTSAKETEIQEKNEMVFQMSSLA